MMPDQLGNAFVPAATHAGMRLRLTPHDTERLNVTHAVHGGIGFCSTCSLEAVDKWSMAPSYASELHDCMKRWSSTKASAEAVVCVHARIALLPACTNHLRCHSPNMADRQWHNFKSLSNLTVENVESNAVTITTPQKSIQTSLNTSVHQAQYCTCYTLQIAAPMTCCAAEHASLALLRTATTHLNTSKACAALTSAG